MHHFEHLVTVWVPWRVATNLLRRLPEHRLLVEPLHNPCGRTQQRV